MPRSRSVSPKPDNHITVPSPDDPAAVLAAALAELREQTSIMSEMVTRWAEAQGEALSAVSRMAESVRPPSAWDQYPEALTTAQVLELTGLSRTGLRGELIFAAMHPGDPGAIPHSQERRGARIYWSKGALRRWLDSPARMGRRIGERGGGE